MSDLVEVAVAASGCEGEDEDGGVVADVDEGGGHDGAETKADVAEDERDTEEEDQDRPGEGDLLRRLPRRTCEVLEHPDHHPQVGDVVVDAERAEHVPA